MSYTGMSSDDWKKLRNKDNTGPQLGEWEAKFGDAKSGKFDPDAPKIDTKASKSDKVDAKATAAKVEAISKGLANALEPLTRPMGGLDNLNTGQLSQVRDQGVKGYQGQSALISGEDTEYRKAKDRIDKKTKKNGY